MHQNSLPLAAHGFEVSKIELKLRAPSGTLTACPDPVPSPFQAALAARGDLQKPGNNAQPRWPRH